MGKGESIVTSFMKTKNIKHLEERSCGCKNIVIFNNKIEMRHNFNIFSKSANLNLSREEMNWKKSNNYTVTQNLSSTKRIE